MHPSFGWNAFRYGTIASLCLALTGVGCAADAGVALGAGDAAPPRTTLTFAPLPLAEVARAGAFIERRAANLPNEALFEITTGHGWYLGTGTRGLIVRSRDGATWEHATLTLPKPDQEPMRHAQFVGNQFILGGSELAKLQFSSVDGVHWQADTTQSLPMDVTSARGVLIGKFMFRDDLEASPDGRKWQPFIRTAFFAVAKNDKPERYAFANERHFVFTSYQRLLESRDRMQWTKVLEVPLQAGGTGGNNKAIVAGNGYVLLVYGDSLFVRDLEGAFTPASIKVGQFAELAYGGGRFLLAMPTANQTHSDIFESVDGRTWTPVATTRHGRVNHIVHGPRGFILGGSGGMIAHYAPAPIAERKLPFPPLVELSPGKLTPVPTEAVATSEGGIERRRLAGLAGDLQHVQFAGDRYAVTTTAGGVLISSDGRTWEGSAVEESISLQRAFSDGTSFAVFSATAGLFHGRAFVSTDRASWTRSDQLPRLDYFTRDARGAIALSQGGRDGGLLSGTAFTDLKPLAIADRRVIDALPVAVFLAHEWTFVLGQRGFFATQDRKLWRREFQVSGGNAIADAWFAQGNNAAVLLITRADRPGGISSFSLHTQTGAAAWATPTPPWRNPRGLAYGLGRYVVVASPPDKPEAALYESPDGVAWTRVGAVDAAARSITYGKPGFVVVGATGEIAIYAPAARTEAPMFTRPPVEPAPPEPSPAPEERGGGGRKGRPQR